MAFKFVVFACLMAAANAGFVPAPLVAGPVLAKAEPYDARPQYAYGYDVQDHLTGDFKSAQESRDGDFVQGSYSVVDPDGTKRTVDYAADPLNGFNAVVRREPLVAAAPVAYAAPVAKYVAPAPAPIVAAAPVAKYVAPGPVAYAPAPVAYAAPFSKYVGAPAPVAYAAGPAPVAYAAGPAPLAYATAPVAKVAAPVTYAASPFARYAAAPAAYPSPLARFAYPAPAYTTFA